VLLWLMEDSPRLKRRARSLILGSSEVYVSSASIWEIAIKFRLGKMQEDPQTVVEKLEAAGLRGLDVTYRHAIATSRLPLIHADPFDRLLVAQAMSELTHLLTTDGQLAAYSELVMVV
jgi:PIN domain nuclease of toxin-antitoxin system